MPELSGPVTLTRASDPWGHRAPEKELGSASLPDSGRGWYDTAHTYVTHCTLTHTYRTCLFLFWLHCLCWVGRLSYPLATKFWVGILVLWPWIKREYPALKGGFLTTGPPRKFPEQFLNTGQSLAVWRQYQVQVRQFLPGGYAVLWKPGQSRWDQKLVLLLMLPLFPRSAVS